MSGSSKARMPESTRIVKSPINLTRVGLDPIV